MWALPENEFAQMHGYYYFSEEMKRDAKDMAGFMTKWLSEIDHYGKPYLFAEFGIVPDKPDTRGLWDRYRQGVHMHNGLWAPLAFGSAWTGTLRWWFNYIDPKDLYFQFRPVAEFVKGIPWTTEGFEKADLESSSGNLRALGLTCLRLTLLWLENREHTWWNVTQNHPIEPVEGATVTVKGVQAGRYKVEYFDTWKGGVFAKSELRAKSGAIHISVPMLKQDIAVKNISRGDAVTDAYCHLAMDVKSPIADIERRMLSANLSHAFLIETWDGRNRPALRQTNKFAVALCYRRECRAELLQLMDKGELTGVRMATEDIRRDKDFSARDCRIGNDAGSPRGNGNRSPLPRTCAASRDEGIRSALGMANSRGRDGWRLGACVEGVHFPALSEHRHFGHRPFLEPAVSAQRCSQSCTRPDFPVPSFACGYRQRLSSFRKGPLCRLYGVGARLGDVDSFELGIVFDGEPETVFEGGGAACGSRGSKPRHCY